MKRYRRFCIALLCLLLLGAALPTSAQEEHRAALVVDFGDGRVWVRVVSFTEETISGVDLLRRSGLDVAMASGSWGVAVCAIEGVGCPPTPQECFCKCRGVPCRYWAYFHLRDGAWIYADRGAADRRLGDGDVDGWVWGDGKTPSPLLTWEEIRAAASSPVPTTRPSPGGRATPPPMPTTARPYSPRSPTAWATHTPGGYLPAGSPFPPASPTPAGPSPGTPERHPETERPTPPPSRTSSPAPATAPATESPLSPAALVFLGTALLLLGLALWVRRRR